ncbi:hypothetical protein, partial [Brucella endophytica]|uniref:hypothetical protein n=2 Tax=Brucella endophytica TaxID=1963359 RepID=UPI0016640F5C
MTKDTDKILQGHSSEETAGNSASEFLAWRSAKLEVLPRRQAGQKAQSSVIQFEPVTGPLNLYDTYTLNISCDDAAWYDIYFDVGPESPPPAEGKPGHTFRFHDGAPQWDLGAYTYLVNGKGSIKITAVGPNRDTKVTVYAYAPFDGNPKGSIDLEFLAVEKPPKSTLGLMSLYGVPLIYIPTATPLLQATWADSEGNPLVGEIEWESMDTYGKATLLSPTTKTAGDGTTVNGATPVYQVTVFDLRATAPDGAQDRILVMAADPWGPNPSVHIAWDETLQQLTATYSGDGTEMLWAAYPADQVAFAHRTTQIVSGSTQNTITFTGDTEVTAYISATTSNPDWGERDYGFLRIKLTPSETCKITVTANPDPIPLYTSDQLTATVTGTDCGVSEIYWSAGALPDGYTVSFSSNSSQVSGNPPTATTSITVTGPNSGTLPSVTVYARPDNSAVPTGSQTFPLTAGSVQPPVNVLVVRSLDGTPLTENEPHLLQATYQKTDGSQKLGGKQIDWSLESGTTAGITLQPTPTTTLDDGTTLTSIEYDTSSGSGVAYVKASSGSDVGRLKVEFTSKADPIPGLGQMTLSGPSGTLPQNVKQWLTCTYVDSSGKYMNDDTPVIWYGMPADRLTFSDGQNAHTGDLPNVSRIKDGKTGINVTASTGPAIDQAVIATTGNFIAAAGAYDHSDPDLVLSFTGQVSDELVVKPDAQPPYSLYTPTKIDATYGGTDKTFSEVSWSVDESKYPGYSFDFDPNPSPVTGSAGNLATFTNLTVIGPNQPLNSVVIYAASVDPDPANYISGASKPISFQQSSQQGTILTISSPDGYVLSEATTHVLEATYTNLDGTPVTGTAWDGTITWSVDSIDPSAAAVKLLDPDPTTANAEGLATNAVTAAYGPDKVTATVKAHAGNMPDTDANNASVTLTFAREIEPVSGQGHMTIIPKDGYVLTRGVPHDLTVYYTDANGDPVKDNTVVTWTGFPEQWLTFTGPTGGNTSTTTNGQATMTVTASIDAPIGTAVITTSAFNATTRS